MTTERAEKFRKKHPHGLPHNKGDSFGWFEVPTTLAGPPYLRVQVSPGFEDIQWEHVSVSLLHRCPTWEEMCKVKDLFWSEDDVVMQLHPKKSEYVNMMKCCLHLWRPADGRSIPTPPSISVGLK